MKPILQKIVFCLLVLGIIFLFSPVKAVLGQSSEFNAGGYNVQRIEQEDKLTVPEDKISEVWDFLYDHYVKDPSTIKKLDPDLASFASDEDFADVYFDTPQLELLQKQNSVRHRKRINLTNASDVKNNRELVQIKVSGISDNKLERGEYKFELGSVQGIGKFEDKLPLFETIKPGQGEGFEERLVDLGIDTKDLRPIFTLEDKRKRIYFNFKDKPYISLSLDHATARIWWAKADFVEIEPEINEITFTEGDAATRQYLEELNTTIIKELKEELPYLKSDLTPKYNKAFNELEKQTPYLRLLIKTNLHLRDPLTLAVETGLVLLLVILGTYLFLKKTA